MKVITSKGRNLLLLLTLLAVALIFIGYNGLGQGGAAKNTVTEEVFGSGQGAETVAETVNKPTGTVSNDNGEFFIEYRLDRERTRGQQVEWLREITNNPNADAETRKKAQEQLYNLSQEIGKEMETENLIRAKGFNDAVVLLQQNQAATVVVRAKELTTDDAAKIADLVARNTGVTPNNIIIIAKP